LYKNKMLTHLWASVLLFFMLSLGTHEHFLNTLSGVHCCLQNKSRYSAFESLHTLTQNYLLKSYFPPHPFRYCIDTDSTTLHIQYRYIWIALFCPSTFSNPRRFCQSFHLNFYLYTDVSLLCIWLICIWWPHQITYSFRTQSLP
jgi:hypothetical protein